MAIIKSYADLQQSKKLAEILPLESADMYYCYEMDIPTRVWSLDNTPTIIDNNNQIDFYFDIPCWSLAALLNVLPKHIPHKDSKITQEKENWYYNLRINDKCLYYACNIIKENQCINIDFFICCNYTENVINACVEMILKLHELNLL